MDLIGLNELARLRKTTRKKMLGALRTMEAREGLSGLLLVQKSKGGKMWVNVEVLAVFRERVYEKLGRRVDGLEGRTKSLEARVDDLEARIV